MVGAKLHGTNLSEANLKKTILHRVDFIESNFNRTKFLQAVCGVTAFSDVELDLAIDLGTVFHIAPSHVDALTLSRVRNSVTCDFLSRYGTPARYIPTYGNIAPNEP
jgi:hypothetical protein